MSLKQKKVSIGLTLKVKDLNQHIQNADVQAFLLKHAQVKV